MNNLVSIKSGDSEMGQDETRSVTTAGNVVSINSYKVLGMYLNALERERIPEEVYFVVGVIFSLVLPQFIYSLYGGFPAVAAFAASGLAGLALGFAKYRRSPYWPNSFFGLEAVPRTPRSEGGSLRKAA